MLQLMDQVETGKVRPDKGWGAVVMWFSHNRSIAIIIIIVFLFYSY